MISSTEKAKKLVDKFKSKKYALLCCNEVLSYMGADRGYAFWKQVRERIDGIKL